MPVKEVCISGTKKCYFQYGNSGKKYYYTKGNRTQRGSAGRQAHIQRYAIEKSMERRRRSSSKYSSPKKRSPKKSSSSKRRKSPPRDSKGRFISY